MIYTDIEIEPHEPFMSRKAIIKSMIESDEFLSPKEYAKAQRTLSRLGYTEYIHKEYHLFYWDMDAQISYNGLLRPPKPSASDFPHQLILAEREFGFYEEISVTENKSAATHKNYHEEFMFEENGVKKILVLDRSADEIKIK